MLTKGGDDREQTHYKIYTRSKRTFNPLTPPQKPVSISVSGSGGLMFAWWRGWKLSETKGHFEKNILILFNIN